MGSASHYLLGAARSWRTCSAVALAFYLFAVTRADDDLSLSRAQTRRGDEVAAKNSSDQSAAIDCSIDFSSCLDAPRLSDELSSQTSVFLV